MSPLGEDPQVPGQMAPGGRDREVDRDVMIVASVDHEHRAGGLVQGELEAAGTDGLSQQRSERPQRAARGALGALASCACEKRDSVRAVITDARDDGSAVTR